MQIPMNILMMFFTEIEKKKILKCVWNHKRLTSQNNLRKAGGILIPDFKLHHGATVMKTSMGVIAVQLLSPVQLFATPWTASCQASLSSPALSWSLLKLTSIELVMLSNHLILCCPFLLLPSIFPSINWHKNRNTDKQGRTGKPGVL